MKVETQNLIGTALDWAVAKCNNEPIKFDPMAFHATANGGYWIWDEPTNAKQRYMQIGSTYSPSTKPEQAYPIIDKEGIAARRHSNGSWYAIMSADLGDGKNASWSEFTVRGGERYGPESYAVHKRQQLFKGDTLLIAAMRCFVANMLGSEVDVPDELTRSA